MNTAIYVADVDVFVTSDATNLSSKGINIDDDIPLRFSEDSADYIVGDEYIAMTDDFFYFEG